MTIFTANISKAAETNTVMVGGTPTLVTNFNVAENYQGRDGERHTQFYRVSLWRDKGAKLAKYLTLGRSITLQGRVKARAYLDKEGKPQCQLEMSNPAITFNTANPSEVDAIVETATEEELPFPDGE